MLRTTSELFPIRNIIKDQCAYHEKLCREAFYATATLFFYARILSNTLPKQSFLRVSTTTTHRSYHSHSISSKTLPAFFFANSSKVSNVFHFC